MDTAALSALAALAGSTIGGMTSLMAGWLTHHVQFNAQERSTSRSRRVDLYKSFIEEASRRYADAYAHEGGDVSTLVNLYSQVSTMRVLSSPAVVESADQVVRTIVETYLAPNKSFSDVTEIIDDKSLDPLRAFGDACRQELRSADPL